MLAGFSMLHSAATGMWGHGTYFSTTPALAKHYAYKLPASAAKEYHPSDAKASVIQLIVADVLTGKSKMMDRNNSLRMPPELEDASLVRLVQCSSFCLPLLTEICPMWAQAAAKAD